MSKPIILYLSLLFSLSSYLSLTRGQTVDCDSLGVSATVAACSPSLPPPNNGVSVVPANTTYTCKLILSFNFTKQYTNIHYANLGVGYGSISGAQIWSYGSYFPAGLYFEPGFVNRGGPANTSTVTVLGNFTVTENAVGAYYGAWSLNLMQFDTRPYVYCFYNGALSPNSALPPNLLVMNDLYTSDITPPYVFSIRVEHDRYRVGDIVRTFAYLVDRSDIFLEDAWTSYSFNHSNSVDCSSATWQKLGETDRIKFGLPGNKEHTHMRSSASQAAQFTSAGAVQVGSATDGWFMTECEVQKGVERGLYNLTLLNIFDIYRNGLDGAPYWTETVYFRIE